MLYSRLVQVKELCNGAGPDGSSYHVSHIGLDPSFSLMHSDSGGPH